MNMGHQIKAIRKQHHLTQDELSLRLNVSRAAVSAWEVGRNCPDLSILVTISDTFNISLDKLLREEYKKEENKKEGL